jgi:FKBP-type peptidyl-prolyl cis-trans isomerase FkpA
MMRKSVGALLVGVALMATGCQSKGAAPAASASASPSAAGMTDEEKAIYALGAAMGQQIEQQVKPLKLNPAEVEILKKGFTASLAGQKPEYAVEQYMPKLQARAEANAKAMAEAERQKAGAFLATAAQEPGVVKTASGLIFKSVSPGSGASPKPTDTVAVNYRGTFIDGTEFDASAKHGGPATFRLNGGVIPCWTEAVCRMKVGEKAHIVCPTEIAYGDRVPPGGPIPPGATLLFDVELLAINPKTAPPPPPGR